MVFIHQGLLLRLQCASGLPNDAKILSRSKRQPGQSMDRARRPVWTNPGQIKDTLRDIFFAVPFFAYGPFKLPSP